MEVGFTAVNKKKYGGALSRQQAADDSGMLICAGISENSASAVRLSLKHLQEAITLIPPSEKRGLSKAMSRFPQFVADEDSNNTNEDLNAAEYLIWFLQAEDYNVWAASRRIAKYWETRIRSYPIQCFLNFPLPFLRSERAMIDNIFNSDHRDKQGRKLIIFRSSLILSSQTVNFSNTTLERLFFYEMSNIAANDKSARILGVVIVAYLPNKEEDVSAILEKISALHSICESLPIRIACVRFITLIEQPAHARTAKETLVPYVAKCMTAVMANPHQNYIGPMDMVRTELDKSGIPVDLVWDVITEGFTNSTTKASNEDKETLDLTSATASPNANWAVSTHDQADASKQPNQTTSVTKNTNTSINYSNNTNDSAEYAFRLQLVQNVLSRYNAQIKTKKAPETSEVQSKRSTDQHPNKDLRRLYRSTKKAKRPRTAETPNLVRVLKDN
jgi:hypothetical protein